jgi:hypothetical protein
LGVEAGWGLEAGLKWQSAQRTELPQSEHQALQAQGKGKRTLGGGYRGGLVLWHVAAETSISKRVHFRGGRELPSIGDGGRHQKTGPTQPHKNEKDKLLVQGGVEDGDQEVRKMSGALVHLKPTNDAMVREILGDAGLGNAEMLGQLRLDGLTVAGRATE